MAAAFDVLVLGSINTDLSFRVGGFPRPGETLLSRGMAVSCGGKGANQAIAAARMGMCVAIVGSVGNEDRGRNLLTSLQRHGVDVDRVVISDDQPTGAAAILVNDGGENLIVVSQGANGHVSPDTLSGLPDARYRLTQLETPRPAVRAFLKEDGPRGVCRILNAAPADPTARELFALCDIVIVNETELATYAGLAVVDQADVATVAATLLSNDTQTIVVTRGRRGALAVRHGVVLAMEALGAKAVDTTGAGDCFCGVVAAAMASGCPFEEAMVKATAAASLTVQRSGVAASLPSTVDVERLIVAANIAIPRWQYAVDKLNTLLTS